MLDRLVGRAIFAKADESCVITRWRAASSAPTGGWTGGSNGNTRRCRHREWPRHAAQYHSLQRPCHARAPRNGHRCRPGCQPSKSAGRLPWCCLTPSGQLIRQIGPAGRDDGIQCLLAGHAGGNLLGLGGKRLFQATTASLTRVEITGQGSIKTAPFAAAWRASQASRRPRRVIRRRASYQQHPAGFRTGHATSQWRRGASISPPSGPMHAGRAGFGCASQSRCGSGSARAIILRAAAMRRKRPACHARQRPTPASHRLRNGRCVIGNGQVSAAINKCHRRTARYPAKLHDPPLKRLHG